MVLVSAAARTQEEEVKEMECSGAGREGYDDIIAALPRDEGWPNNPLRKYQNFWCLEIFLPVDIAIQRTFMPRPSDILLITPPKSGTTWLKALAFSILNRDKHPPGSHDHPLLTSNPHTCVPFLYYFYDDDTLLVNDALDSLPSPRLVSLHSPRSLLPESVVESNCRIIYLCRDPKDTLVSLWSFLHEVLAGREFEPFPIEKAFELFCRGVFFYGPIWDHQLGYWQASRERPDKVMFLKYEDMKADAGGYVNKMAEFMGCPFSEGEERGGIVEEIVRLCSFESLSSKEAPTVKITKKYENKSSVFFRKGEVGDWRNHMSIEMARRLDEITEEKFRGTGLSFPDS